MIDRIARLVFCGVPMMCLADPGVVRSALDRYVDSVRRTSVRVETIRNVGIANADGAAYLELCGVVSNNLEEVLQNMPSITTNAAERLVLMSTAWRYDEDYYLRGYSALAELALSNQVTNAELEWYGLPERNDLANCLRCRYRESVVTNLVQKILQVTGNTNLHHAIISGAAYTNYLEEVSAGLW